MCEMKISCKSILYNQHNREVSICKSSQAFDLTNLYVSGDDSYRIFGCILENSETEMHIQAMQSKSLSVYTTSHSFKRLLED